MSVTLGPNYVSGITTATNSTDVAFKEYADNKPGVTIPDTAGNNGKLLFTDGSTVSWEVAATYQEYDTAGSYSFSIPSRARKLTIEASGAGGGGASGNLDGSTYVVGSVWTIRTRPFGFSSVDNKAVTFGDSGFLATGQSGYTMFSTDTITWVLRTTGTGTSQYLSAAFGDGLYFIGGGSGRLNTSTDTIHWELRTSGFTSNIFALTFGNNTYLAAGQNGVLNTSTDTIHWTLRTAGFATNIIYSLNFLNNTYFAGGNAGLNSSTDAIHWTLRTANAVYDLIYFNGLYGAAAGNGIIFSTDSIHWIQKTNLMGQALSITYNDNVYLTTSGSVAGRITTSTVELRTGIGGDGIKGGGGGGGSISNILNTTGPGGRGGDGYVRISWV